MGKSAKDSDTLIWDVNYIFYKFFLLLSAYYFTHTYRKINHKIRHIIICTLIHYSFCVLNY
jgi:hypothetical protein